jgi:hypothetical protein
MEEKELIKKIKNSLKAKKSKAEIMSGFQKRGYKLEYADKLINKTKHPKKIALLLSISIVLLLTLTLMTYTIVFDKQNKQFSNPISGFASVGYASSNTNFLKAVPTTKVSYDQIEITPELILSILDKIDASKLHKNLLTQENPIINFKIGTETFYSEIKKSTEVYKGLSEAADLQFNINRRDLIDAVFSENFQGILKESITSGRTEIELKAGEAELFAKGYLKLYSSLK